VFSVVPAGFGSLDWRDAATSKKRVSAGKASNYETSLLAGHTISTEIFQQSMSKIASERASRFDALTQPSLIDIKRSSVGGAFANVSAQGLKFVIQTATTMILARLLSPQDFGLQGMVVVITSFLTLFQDAGLSMATIQSPKITHEQTSTLFWVNVAFGTVLAMLCAVLAPLIVRFYHEPRLYWIAVVSGVTFIFNGLTAQHGALLTRSMRFVTQANFGVLTLLAGSVTGIVMAMLGCGYWSLERNLYSPAADAFGM
jgi:hypothetical protein